MHNPVMLKEVIKFLDIKQDGLYIDFTYGAGGHSKEILKYLNKKGNLISLDKDILSCILAKKNKNESFHMSFKEFKKKSNFFSNVDGIIIDLGMSSDQIQDTKMGLSFNKNTHLDMRINSKQKLRASDWINFVNKKDLNDFLNFFFKEKLSAAITKNIIKFKKKKYIKTTKDLCFIITKTINSKHHLKSISKIFTIIKVLINNELFVLNMLLKNIKNILKNGGILIIISFNSIEDKIVKNFFFKKNFKNKIQHISSRPNIKEIDKNYPSRSAIMHTLKILN